MPAPKPTALPGKTGKAGSAWRQLSCDNCLMIGQAKTGPGRSVGEAPTPRSPRLRSAAPEATAQKT